MKYAVHYSRRARGHRITSPDHPAVFASDRVMAGPGEDEADAIQFARDRARGHAISSSGQAVPDVDDWTAIEACETDDAHDFALTVEAFDRRGRAP